MANEKRIHNTVHAMQLPFVALQHTKRRALFYRGKERERRGGGRKGKENKKKKRVGHRDRRSKAEKGK